MQIFPQNYKAYEMTCFDIQLGKHTIIAGSEEAAIASFKRTYPRADKVWADEVVEGANA